MTLGRWARDPTVYLVGELPDPSHLDPEAIVVVAPDPTGLDETISLVVERLRSDPRLDAAAPLVAVTDAVKRVDDSDLIVETLDRAGLGYAGYPLAVRGRAVNAGAIEVLGWV